MDTRTQSFLNTVNSHGPQIYELSIAAARKVLVDAQSGPVTKLPADIEEHIFPVGPQGKVSVRIYRPAGNQDLLPVILYFHGGGWVLGDKDTHDRLARELANNAGAALVFVSFTPSPEVIYPVAIEEAYAAMKYVFEKGITLNLDSSRIAVAGDSAGGNMAAALTLLSKERNGPPIIFQLLFYPVTDADDDTASYRQFSKGYFLTRRAMKWFWDHYLPDKNLRKNPTVSPLRASPEQLKNLPPALIITAEYDVLRDEGEEYAAHLSAAGVPVTAVRYLGIIHDFVMLNALSETPAARSAVRLASHALQDAFYHSQNIPLGSNFLCHFPQSIKRKLLNEKNQH